MLEGGEVEEQLQLWALSKMLSAITEPGILAPLPRNGSFADHNDAIPFHAAEADLTLWRDSKYDSRCILAA